MSKHNFSDDVTDKDLNDIYNSLNQSEPNEEDLKRMTNEQQENSKNPEHKDEIKEKNQKELLNELSKRSRKEIDEKIEQTQQEIENIENKSIYNIPHELQEKGYYTDETGIYCPLDADDYYLKMWIDFPDGNTKKTYYYSYYDKTNNILHPFHTELKSSIYNYVVDGEDDKKTFSKNLRKLLGHGTNFIDFNRSHRDDGERFVIENLESIYNDFMNLMKKGKLITVLTPEYNKKKYAEDMTERIEDNNKTKMKSFEKYPVQIQKDAIELLESGGLFNHIKKTVQLTHANDEKLIETLTLICASIYSGTPVQTIVGGETGKGKTDITQTIVENYPDGHVFYLRTFSPKYIYYDKDSFNEDYNILLIDDVDLSKKANVETIKELTDNKKKIKELRTVIDGKAVRFTLKGKFIVILTYAKTNPDLELGNRLFNTGIITDKNEESKVKHQIKSNAIIGTDSNLIIQQLQETNKCAITKLLENNYEIFNPYLLFLNPEQFNNRDVSSFINLVNAHTFYNTSQRQTLQIDDKKIKIGKKEDIDKVLSLWDSQTQKYKLTTRQQQILELKLPEYTLEEAMEQQQSIIEAYNDSDSAGYKEQLKKEQWSRERIGREIEVNSNTLRFDLDTNKADTNNDTLYSLGLIERYKFDPDSNNSMWVYYKPKNKNDKINSKSKINSMYGCAIEKYMQNITLKDKIKVIINLLYMYNYVINKRDIIYIKKYCEEFEYDIANNVSMFNFINEFFINYDNNLVKKNEDISINDIKNMFNLIKPYLINEDNTKNKYIYTKSSVDSNSVHAKKTVKKALNSNLIQNHNVHLKNTISTGTKNLNKEHSVDFDLEEVVNSNTNSNISINDVNELIQNNLEYNPKGLTYEKITEIIFEHYNLSPDSEDIDYIILRIKNALDDLIKSNIILEDSDGFKQIYILSDNENEEEY